MKRLKIAVLVEVINSHSGSRAPIEIAKNLAKLGNTVSIYASDNKLDKNLQAALIKSGVVVEVISRSGSLLATKFLPDLRLARLLKKYHPDLVVLAAFLPSLLAAKLAKIPVLRIYMGTQFDAYLERKLPGEKINFFDLVLNTLANIYIYLVDFFSLHLSNLVVAISKFTASETEKLFKKKVDKVIYLGGNHLPKVKPKTKIKNEVFNILSVSRITPYKGFHLLIEVLKKLKTTKRVTLSVAGSTGKPQYLYYLNYLKKIAPKKVRIFLNPSDYKLAQLYQVCDVYITADRYLFFGFPIAEAAFFSKPAIALNFAAANEIIDSGKTGFIVKNQQEMEAALLHLIENDHARRKMGQAALKRAQKIFIWRQISKRYNELIDKKILVNKSSKR